MMISQLAGRQVRARERGVTLVIALVFMVALTLLGVGMVRSTTSEERMGSNSRDYDRAFAAAEAAVRDAEIRVQGTYVYPSAQLSFLNFPNSADTCGTATSGTSSEKGLCNAVAGQPIYTNTTYSLDSTTYAAPLGTYTGTPSIQGVSAQPNYFIEFIRIPVFSQAGGSMNVYRITAKGWGIRSSTQVLLQEVYVQ